MNGWAALIVFFCGTTALCAISLWYVGRFKGEPLTRVQRLTCLGWGIALLAVSCYIIVMQQPNGI